MRRKKRKLWHAGCLFHATHRYPRKPDRPRVDRLAGILRHGLLAPAQSQDGLVFSDFRIQVIGTDISYDSLVFLHRYREGSHIYTIAEPGRFFVFVDKEFPVLTAASMGANWAILCQDEVYVQGGIAPEHIAAIAVHPEDGGTILSELQDDIRRAGVALCDFEGHVLWDKETEGERP